MKKKVFILIVITLSVLFSFKEDNKIQIPNVYIKPEPSLSVKATIYNPERGQTDSDPLTTASGDKICLNKLKNKELHWIAVSRDIINKTLKYDDTVYIKELNQFYIVKDKLGAYAGKGKKRRVIKNQIDLLTHRKYNKEYAMILHKHNYTLTVCKVSKLTKV